MRHVHLGHGPGLYALEGGGRSEYLVCERCSRVDTVEAQELDRVRADVRERFGYEVRFSHFPIVGLCAACAAAGSAPALAPAHHGHGHAHSHGDYVHEHDHDHDTVAESEHGHLPRG